MATRRRRNKFYLLQTRKPHTWVYHELFSPVHEDLITTYMSTVVQETPIKVEDQDAEDSGSHTFKRDELLDCELEFRFL